MRSERERLGDPSNLISGGPHGRDERAAIDCVGKPRYPFEDSRKKPSLDLVSSTESITARSATISMMVEGWSAGPLSIGYRVLGTAAGSRFKSVPAEFAEKI